MPVSIHYIKTISKCYDKIEGIRPKIIPSTDPFSHIHNIPPTDETTESLSTQNQLLQLRSTYMYTHQHCGERTTWRRMRYRWGYG